MADATQELMLRVRGDNSGADKAIANTKTSIEGLRVSGEKASGAFKNFSRSLAEARDASDVAASAANSLSNIVGKSLMGAFAVGGVKLFTDQINRMGESVKATATEAQQAFDNIEKAGQAMSLSEATSQVAQLDTLLASTSKKLSELDRSPFQNFIAGATGARVAMEELVGTSQRLRDMKIAEGMATENANAEFTSGLDQQAMQIYKVNAEYEKRSKFAQTFTDKEAYRIYQEASAAQKVRETNAIIDKGIEERSAKERDASEKRRKNTMDEFQLDQDLQNRKTEAESKAFFEKLEYQKQLLEQAKKIEESELKLNELLNKRIEIQDQLKQAQQGETIRQGELATMAAGAGGSLRGAGQRKTSFEIGLEKSANRAYQNEINRQAAGVDEDIAFGLYIQKSIEGLDPRVSKNEIQNEKVRRAEQAATERAKRQFEDPYQKQIDKTTKALKDNEQQISRQKKTFDDAISSAGKFTETMFDASSNMVDNFLKPGAISGGAEAGGGGKDTGSLSGIAELLQKNFDELKAYAHAT
jgi:hypothetical protein